MKIGIIDIGSNTVRLVIFEVDKEKKTYQKIFDYKKMLQILNYIEDGILNISGTKALIAALSEYKAMTKIFDVDEFYCFATASLRYLKNQKEVIQHVSRDALVEIELLSGDDEATLGFQASAHALNFEGVGLSMDVGGGSTELVYFDKETILGSVSLPIGSLSQYIRFVDNLFPTQEEIINMQKAIQEELKKIEWMKLVRVDSIIGIGGSARAITRISKELYNTKQKDEGKALGIKYVHQIANLDLSKDHQTAELIIKEIVERASTIIPGTIIFSVIAKAVGAKRMILSRSGIREGYLLKKINE